MRTRTRRRVEALPGVVGVARVDRRVDRVARRAKPGDIAIVDHLDLDRAAAEALVAAGVSAVLNVAPSISGRYPALGPQVLIDSGVALLDEVGPELFACVRDGEVIRLDADTVYDTAAQPLLRGVRQTPEAVAGALAAAREGLAAQLSAFTSATAGHLLAERDLLVDGVGLPDASALLAGQAVLVVGPGAGARSDLARLRGFIRTHRPVLVGVDGGADVLLAAGLRVHLLVAGPQSAVSNAAVSAAETLVTTVADDRFRELGRAATQVQVPTRFPATAVALLLCTHADAALVVTTGVSAEMIDLMATGAAGTAGEFLARLRCGGRLLDAAAAALLCPPRRRGWLAVRILLALLAVAVVAGAVATAAVWGRGYSPWTPDGWVHLWHRIAAASGVL